MTLLRATARPRLVVETLEPRDCPACTVFESNFTGYVLGDDTANSVVITDPLASHNRLSAWGRVKMT